MTANSILRRANSREMKQPIFHSVQYRKAFFTIPTDVWVLHHAIDASQECLLAWLKHGWIEREQIASVGYHGARFQYRRVFAMDEGEYFNYDEMQAQLKRERAFEAAAERAAKLLTDDVRLEAKRVMRSASDDDLTAWTTACARVHSLGAIVGLACPR